MRTTLTLDDDVAEQLAWLRDERKMTLREAVNITMRKGLATMAAESAKPHKRFKTPTFKGKWLLPPDIISTHDMLTWAEGETYR
jgi:hypothetical protein